MLSVYDKAGALFLYNQFNNPSEDILFNVNQIQSLNINLLENSNFSLNSINSNSVSLNFETAIMEPT